VSNETIFASCQHDASSGILGISAKTGRVLQMSIHPENLVPYILETLSDSDLAISISSRLNLPGASDLYIQEFNRLALANDVPGAARIAVSAPGNMLRTPETINRFQGMQGEPGKPQPVFQYFYVILEKSKFFDFESIELVRPVVAQGRAELVTKWLNEDKLTCTEQLGDMLMQAGQASLAQKVYEGSASSEKVIGAMLQQGNFENIVDYAASHSVRADYSHMLQQLVRSNPQGAVDFAKRLATAPGGSLIDLNHTVDIFMSMNLLRETTAFLLKALEGDRREEGYLQTRLLEINLRGGAPQVADAILENKMFSQYD
jgi:clathrin heavy chain